MDDDERFNHGKRNFLSQTNLISYYSSDMQQCALCKFSSHELPFLDKNLANTLESLFAYLDVLVLN